MTSRRKGAEYGSPDSDVTCAARQLRGRYIIYMRQRTYSAHRPHRSPSVRPHLIRGRQPKTEDTGTSETTSPKQTLPLCMPGCAGRTLLLAVTDGTRQNTGSRLKKMPVYKLTTQAYCKMMLHGAKHPTCAVNGVLVAEKRKDVHQHQVLFVDCIPLFHGPIALSPVLEVALTLIDTWCKENGYIIAGYYQGNERLKDNSLNPVAERIASRIADCYSDAALIMVDNARFSVECIYPSIHIYDVHDNRWKARDPHEDIFEDWPEAQRITASLMDSRSYETLVDFDSHLDDLRNDWANPEINKSIIHLC